MEPEDRLKKRWHVVVNDLVGGWDINTTGRRPSAVRAKEIGGIAWGMEEAIATAQRQPPG